MNEDKSCPIELAAQLLIDKWSVVILRDVAFFNRLSFRDILTKNLENISSSTLSSRLKRLQDLNLLTRKDDKLNISGCDIKPVFLFYWH